MSEGIKGLNSNEFLMFVACEGDERLKKAVFDCMVFYKNEFEKEPSPASVDAYVTPIYNFGEWLEIGGNVEYYLSEVFELADKAVHAASNAKEMFPTMNTAKDWGMDWDSYLLFNTIANELTSVSLRAAIMDFYEKRTKRTNLENLEMEDREI